MKISPQTLEIVQTLRDCVRADDGSCQELLQCLTDMPEFEGASVTAGFFVPRDGNIKDGHVWLVLPDESCFDPSQDQFGDNGFGDIVHLSKKDARFQHYFPYTGKPGIPMDVLNFADKIQARLRTQKNRSFSEMIQEEPEVIPEQVKWVNLDQLLEASSASPSSDVARQSSTDLPDYVTSGGYEGIPQDDEDEEFKPEEFEDILRQHLTDDLSLIDLDESLGLEEYRESAISFFSSKTVQEYISDVIEDTLGERPSKLKLIGSVTNPDKFNENSDIDMGVYFGDSNDLNEEISNQLQKEMIKHPFQDFGVVNVLVFGTPHMKEVDHPEYMPGGDETHGYDPNYDPAHQERRSGYNTGHPEP